MQAGQPPVELHIEELVLEGFSWIDQAQMSAVVQRELARLLAERGAPPAWIDGNTIGHIDGGSFMAEPNADMESLGSQIAGALYRGIEHG